MNQNQVKSYESQPHMELYESQPESYESQPHIESWITTTDVKYDLRSKVIRTN